MKLRVLLAAILPILGCVFLMTSPAHAQATRTWVSGVGDDANPCSRTAPCKTFAGAISKTAAGGEINCLDPAGYGAVTIVKSITLMCFYTEGGITSPSTNAINISAASTDTVVLDGLDIEGVNQGLDGIRINNAHAVVVRHTRIRGCGQNGIEVVGNTASGNPISLVVTDTIIEHTGFNGSVGVPYAGINISPQQAVGVTVDIKNVTIDNAYNGVMLKPNSPDVRVTITDSIIAHSTVDGIYSTTTTPKARVLISTSDISYNAGVGIHADGAQSKLWVGNNDMTGNNTGVSATNGAALQTYGNNRLTGSIVGDGAFTGPVAAQ